MFLSVYYKRYKISFKKIEVRLYSYFVMIRRSIMNTKDMNEAMVKDEYHKNDSATYSQNEDKNDMDSALVKDIKIYFQVKLLKRQKNKNKNDQRIRINISISRKI